MAIEWIPVPLHGQIIDVAYRRRVGGRLHVVRMAKKPKPVRRAPLIWVRTRLPVAPWRKFNRGIPMRRVCDGLAVEDWQRGVARLLLAREEGSG